MQARDQLTIFTDTEAVTDALEALDCKKTANLRIPDQQLAGFSSDHKIGQVQTCSGLSLEEILLGWR